MIALFAGTFDPPTKGHMEVIERASALFDELIIGIGQNVEKEQPLLSFKQRLALLDELTQGLGNVTVSLFSGLVTEFAKAEGATLLIRGLRSSQDFERETQMAAANYSLAGIETLFLPARDAPLLSGSLIRELVKNRAPLANFVPHQVESTIYS